MYIVKKEVDYAIRIVAYLMGKRSLVKTEEISNKIFISLPNTIKILHKLSKCGIIITKTGKNGGNLLEKNVENLSVLDIIRCMGFDFEVNACVNVPDSCKLNPICNITHFFADIQYGIIDKLKNAKIKDFVFDDEALNKIGGMYE
ncbi:MAG: Rrf2 family transcriptional regulator [Calditerrivibrio sp.]|nr:Rrf2 family transcriptional regulator [Calditerrivibrio sp.]MCA1932217.1 Rrf2 family transcriptional regulator [Calditerrivibrio sp.]